MTAPADATPIAAPDALSYVDDAPPFSPEVIAILATEVNPELVEVRQPNDLLYVPWIHYQTILVKAFGPGGFRMIPKGPPRLQGNQYTWHGSLWVRAPGQQKFQFIDEAVGECNIQSAGNGAEGAKSDCLVKSTKRLGIFMELFDPAWRRAWEAKYKARHLAAKGKREWVGRDRASGASVSAGSSSSAPGGPAGSSAAPAEAPASVPSSAATTGDTGEAASEEQLDALTAEIRRRRWTRKYVETFMQTNFKVPTMSGLTAQQAARALVLVMARPAPEARP